MYRMIVPAASIALMRASSLSALASSASQNSSW
jgi:hypothetical protein